MTEKTERIKKIYIAHPIVGDRDPASPWGNPDANMDRYLRICALATEAGMVVVSFAHHVLMHRAGLTCSDGQQSEHDYYLPRDERLIDGCDEVWICSPVGASLGVRREAHYAAQSRTAVRYVWGEADLQDPLWPPRPAWPPASATAPWPYRLDRLVEDSHGIAKGAGWWEGLLREGTTTVDPEKVPVGEKLMLIVTELAEVMEDYRRAPEGGLSASFYEVQRSLHGMTHGPGDVTLATPVKRALAEQHPDAFKPCGIPSELADVAIRLADLAGALGIDLEQAIIEKHRYNRTRAYRHGGKRA